ncbi:MAG: integron integrase [Planctomycetota bacterium]
MNDNLVYPKEITFSCNLFPQLPFLLLSLLHAHPVKAEALRHQGTDDTSMNGRLQSIGIHKHRISMIWRLSISKDTVVHEKHETFQSVLDGFSKFLRERNLVPPKHRPYLVRWVRAFLVFSRSKREYTFDQKQDLFVAELERRNRVESWQIRQAIDAVRIFHFQYKPPSANDSGGSPVKPSLVNDRDLMSRLQEIIRLRHYAKSTEKTYLLWVRKFLVYRRQTNQKGPPTAEDVKAFLTRLAMVDNVSASTQNQAFSALLLLFREVLRVDLEEMAQTVRAKRGRKLPVVLSADEVRNLLASIESNYRLMVNLLYGSGLRLTELLKLRVKDIDFDAELIYVRSGKGDKDRTTLLPASLADALQSHLKKVREWHEKDLANGFGEAPLPYALARKYPSASREWAWQYAFPADKVALDPSDGKVRRYHVYGKTVQAAVRRARGRAGIDKHATIHTLRHCFATHLLLKGTDIREIQELLGHKSVETTMVYTHVVRDLKTKASSPLDDLAP